VIAGTPAGPSATSVAPDTGRWVLAATILGSSIVFIDSSVVNVALPTIQDDLGASAAATQWVVEAYALFLAALILAGGALGDRFGRRRLFVIGTALFALTSVWCGLAPNVEMLIAARAAQGVAGALLTPASLALISASFVDEGERGRAIGTWSGFTSITSALGPVLGGWLVETASWRWIFFLNLPLAAGVLAIALRRLPESRDPTVGPLDWPGAMLATVGLGALVFGLIEAQVAGWSDPRVLVGLIGGAVALVGFVAVEARSPAPLMPLGLFRSRTFSGANLLTLLLYAALGGALYFVPFLLIQVQGYGATAAGAAFLPFVLLMFGLSRWSGGLVGAFGPRLPLVVGPLIAAVGFVLFAVPGLDGSYWTTYFPAVVVLGLGMAVTVAPLTTAVMGAVEASHSGVASGVNNAVARTASLLAIALFGIAVAFAFERSLDDRLDGLELDPAARAAIEAQEGELAAATAPAELDQGTRAAVDDAIDRSFLSGFRLAMLLAAAMAVASAVAAGLLIEGKKPAAADRSIPGLRNRRTAPNQHEPSPGRAVGGSSGR
jgi:EmrB/QacA subfamily drug resistance transporter